VDVIIQHGHGLWMVLVLACLDQVTTLSMPVLLKLLSGANHPHPMITPPSLEWQQQLQQDPAVSGHSIL
jgi:hypothetical protein